MKRKLATLDWPEGGRFMRQLSISPRALSGGPSWVDSDRYDIVAKAPGAVKPATYEQIAMIRKLLTDQAHLPSRKAPPLVFALSPMGARPAARDASMAELVWVMQRSALDRPVVDQTGLSGNVPSRNPDEPDLITAMQQQLGAKLEAMTGPIDALVIDKAQRPSENRTCPISATM